MGKLTAEVFNESCCDGGATNPNDMSAQPCGCDPGAGWTCRYHQSLRNPIQLLAEAKPMAEHREIRTFDTGATRDLDVSKFDFEGFESPLVMERFAEFMHTNRLQKDGTLRASDNWQKGIPKDAYMKSMWRHLVDVWLHHRGWGSKAKEPLEVALCALRFNVSGYLFEVLKEKV